MWLYIMYAHTIDSDKAQILELTRQLRLSGTMSSFSQENDYYLQKIH